MDRVLDILLAPLVHFYIAVNLSRPRMNLPINGQTNEYLIIFRVSEGEGLDTRFSGFITAPRTNSCADRKLSVIQLTQTVTHSFLNGMR